MRPWHRFQFRRDHRWTPGHLSAYLDADLRAAARARLERHTAECPDCNGVLDSLRFMLGRLHQVQAAELSAEVPDITGAVLRRLHEPSER
jgi:anti-sigma factor RsiW